MDWWGTNNVDITRIKKTAFVLGLRWWAIEVSLCEVHVTIKYTVNEVVV